MYEANLVIVVLPRKYSTT